MTVVYHYTDASGLQGILKSKSLWLSDYRFLNDPSEFQHGWAMIRESIKAHSAEIRVRSPDAWLLVDSLQEKVDQAGIVGFVGSLSMQGDLLSQWRGYNDGKGFSIGINADWLLQNAYEQGFTLFPVAYDTSLQARSADAALTLLLGMLDGLAGDPTRVNETVSGWWRHALKVALAFKNEHFREEEEQRVAYVGTDWPNDVQVRTGQQGLIPYVPCKLDRKVAFHSMFDPVNLGIERIIAGPAFRPQQVSAVQALLRSQMMRVEVVRSAIPYIAE